MARGLVKERLGSWWRNGIARNCTELLACMLNNNEKPYEKQKAKTHLVGPKLCCCRDLLMSHFLGKCTMSGHHTLRRRVNGNPGARTRAHGDGVCVRVCSDMLAQPCAVQPRCRYAHQCVTFGPWHRNIVGPASPWSLQDIVARHTQARATF